MYTEKLKETAKLLGEGFFADRVINENDKVAVRNYGYSILEAKNTMDSEKMSLKSLLSLHCYVRFLTWIGEEYGKEKFKSETEAQTFLVERINDLLYFRVGWKNFFRWLQKKTLEETSELMYL